MDREKTALLKAELDAQRREIAAIYDKITDRGGQRGAAAVESLGYQLHNLYCAFEDSFKIVAAAFENHIEDKSKYHSELLKRMTLTIEGVRPSLLSHESYALLDNLRAFRHFFRHAYAYELDERKVRIVLEDAGKLKDLYKKDLDAFLGIFSEP